MGYLFAIFYMEKYMIKSNYSYFSLDNPRPKVYLKQQQVYGHANLNKSDPAWSRKLSRVGPG